MKAFNYLLVFMFAASVFSCKSTKTEETETEVVPQTPVSVTTIGTVPLNEYIEVNATSTYMQKSYIVASTSGYIQTENARKGRYVQAGQTLFSLITKEARAIGNTINKLDRSFRFSGVTNIRANASGYISELNHQKGDYVPEGEQLAVISNSNSFVFLADVPYEQSSLLKSQKSVEIILPDGKHFSGYVNAALPTVDSASQTQRFAIRANTNESIPEGLVAKIRVLKVGKSNAISLPKAAILTNETEEEFWVMKLINDTTAVKTPIEKGLEVGDRVEIISPKFAETDRVITVGNYGLADTAKIKIVQQ